MGLIIANSISTGLLNFVQDVMLIMTSIGLFYVTIRTFRAFIDFVKDGARS